MSDELCADATASDLNPILMAAADSDTPISTEPASASGETARWTQRATVSMQGRLADVFGFLMSDSARCSVAVWFGIQAFDRNSIPELCDASATEHLAPDAREKYRTLVDESYLGEGERVTWKQTVSKELAVEMERRLPQVSSRPAQTRAFMALGLTGVEIGIGLGDVISEKAFRQLSDGGGKGGGG